VNPYAHSILSVRRRGGKIEDYYPIHDFMDSTKELCSDNRHRILHTLWGIRRVIVPIFGATLINSDGRTVSVKDLCEQDHVLPDYANRFIPTLEDFAQALCEVTEYEAKLIDSLHRDVSFSSEMRELLMSPLHVTGKLSSLLITHNSWFLSVVIPRLFTFSGLFKDFPVTPGHLFSKLSFEPWMDNGRDLPPSQLKSDLRLSGVMF